MRHLLAPITLCILAAAPAAAQPCPVDPAAGYPVTATAEQTGVADAAWLSSVARSAAYRWRVPARGRNAYAGWERVRRRILPPEPRWADDWSPEPSHRAVLRLVIYGDGREPRAEVVAASGDRRFDASLESIASDPMPASPPMPPLPAGAGDSVVVRLALGAEPDPAGAHGLVRFAAVQTRARLHRHTLRVVPPPGFRGRFEATVKYDVREDGSVDAGSIEFLRGGSAAVETAIRDGLMQARFTPPTSNCRPVGQSVVQTFGR